MGYVVKERYIVRGPDRKEHRYYFCGGRGWPKEDTIVEVVEGPDPSIDCVDDVGNKFKKPIVDKVSVEVMAKLKADKRLTIRRVGEAVEASETVDVLKLLESNDALQEQVRQLTDKLAFSEKRLAEAQSMLEEATRPTSEDIRRKRKG